MKTSFIYSAALFVPATFAAVVGDVALAAKIDSVTAQIASQCNLSTACRTGVEKLLTGVKGVKDANADQVKAVIIKFANGIQQTPECVPSLTKCVASINAKAST